MSKAALSFLLDNQAFPAGGSLPTDLGWGFISQSLLRKLRQEKLILAFESGKPVRLSAAGRRAAMTFRVSAS